MFRKLLRYENPPEAINQGLYTAILIANADKNIHETIKEVISSLRVKVLQEENEYTITIDDSKLRVVGLSQRLKHSYSTMQLEDHIEKAPQLYPNISKIIDYAEVILKRKLNNILLNDS